MRLHTLRTHAGFLAAIAIALVASAPIMAAGAARAEVARADKPTGEGKLNSIDAANRKLNITHGPIVALNWPGMTMDFGVAPGVDLTALKAGTKISFTLAPSADGTYVIEAVKPAP